MSDCASARRLSVTVRSVAAQAPAGAVLPQLDQSLTAYGQLLTKLHALQAEVADSTAERAWRSGRQRQIRDLRRGLGYLAVMLGRLVDDVDGREAVRVLAHHAT